MIEKILYRIKYQGKDTWEKEAKLYQVIPRTFSSAGISRILRVSSTIDRQRVSEFRGKNFFLKARREREREKESYDPETIRLKKKLISKDSVS